MADAPDNSQNYSPTQEKQHYESLIKLFESSFKLVTWIISAFLLLIGTGIYFITFKSNEEMKASVERTEQRLKDRLGQIEKDLERARQDAKDNSKELENRVSNSVLKADQNVSEAKTEALNKISNVRSLAIETAKNEAISSIEQQFKNDNIQQLVENTAQSKLGPQLEKIVNSQLTVFSESLDSQQAQIILINNSYPDFAKGIDPHQLKVIDSLRQHSKHQFVRKYANEQLVNINDKFGCYRSKLMNISLNEYLKNFHPELINEKNQQRIVQAIARNIYKGNFTTVLCAFGALNYITEGRVGMVDYESLDNWLNIYTKQPYQLRFNTN